MTKQYMNGTAAQKAYSRERRWFNTNAPTKFFLIAAEGSPIEIGEYNNGSDIVIPAAGTYLCNANAGIVYWTTNTSILLHQVWQELPFQRSI